MLNITYFFCAYSNVGFQSADRFFDKGTGKYSRQYLLGCTFKRFLTKDVFSSRRTMNGERKLSLLENISWIIQELWLRKTSLFHTCLFTISARDFCRYNSIHSNSNYRYTLSTNFRTNIKIYFMLPKIYYLNNTKWCIFYMIIKIIILFLFKYIKQ